MTQNLTIGFIGYGNMAQAIAQGFVDAGVVTGGQMVACAAHYDKLEKTTAELGLRPLRNALEVVTAADVVIIAIKPYQIAAVVKPLADELAKPGKIVVSIAAGWNLKKYQDLFATEDGESVDSSDIHIQCTIPNTPMAVGKGVLVTESVNTLTDDETETFEQLFGPISLIERVDTAHMNIAMVVAGCAPAFTDMYIEALGDAGVQYGLQRATAYRLAAKMVEGVGALYMATETHPGAMKDAVCSPGGTTIKGVAQLEKDGFRGSVIDAVWSASAGYNTQTGVYGTCSGLDAWGTDVPYLQSVESPYEEQYHNLMRRIIGKDYRYTEYNDSKTGQPYESADTTHKDLGGYVQYNTFVSNGRSYRYIGQFVSSRYCFDFSADENGTPVMNYYGYGHGVGMSQCGAVGYASEQGMNYKNILKHYYTGASISTSGSSSGGLFSWLFGLFR